MYARLRPSEAREAARQVLVRLAEQDDQGTIAATPVPVAEIDPAGRPGAHARQVVETLVRRRLLARDGDHVEVAHEALLAAWPRLAAMAGGGQRRPGRASPPAPRPRSSGTGRAPYRTTSTAVPGSQAAADWADDPDPAPRRSSGSSSPPAAHSPSRSSGTPATGRRPRRRHGGGPGVSRWGWPRSWCWRSSPPRWRSSSSGRRTGGPRRPRPPGRSPTPTGWPPCHRRRGRWTCPCCWRSNAVRTAVTPATEDGLLNALLEHRRATEVHAVPTGAAEISVSVDGRTAYAAIGGPAPGWCLGGSASVGAPGAGELVARLISAAPDGRSVAAAGFLRALDRGPGEAPRGLLPGRTGAEGVGGATTRGHPARRPLHAVGAAARGDATWARAPTGPAPSGRSRGLGRVRVLRLGGTNAGQASALGASFTPDASRVVTWAGRRPDRCPHVRREEGPADRGATGAQKRRDPGLRGPARTA